MKIIPWMKGCVLTFPLALSLLTATPALARGDGPLTQCLTEAQGDADAFEACLIQHEAELEASYALPANWLSRLRICLQSHPDGWDRLEDLIDRLENRWDRAENRRERQEDRRDRVENRWDRREGVRGRMENRWDRWHWSMRNSSARGEAGDADGCPRSSCGAAAQRRAAGARGPALPFRAQPRGW